MRNMLNECYAYGDVCKSLTEWLTVQTLVKLVCRGSLIRLYTVSLDMSV